MRTVFQHDVYCLFVVGGHPPGLDGSLDGAPDGAPVVLTARRRYSCTASAHFLRHVLVRSGSDGGLPHLSHFIGGPTGTKLREGLRQALAV